MESRISIGSHLGFQANVGSILLLGLLLLSCGQTPTSAPAATPHVLHLSNQFILASSGVTLPLRPGPGTPRITRAQALAIATHDVSPAGAQSVTAQYILLDWPTFSPSATSFQPIMHHPTWLVTYEGVLLSFHGPPDQLQRHPVTIGSDFIFIDASTGQVIGVIA